MTNNPTIDGVSREFLERIRQYLIDIGEIGEFGAELFQLLNVDAPAVKRQEFGDPVGSFDKHMEYMQENIRLQSTIAQLQARVQELESGRGEPVAWRGRNSIGDIVTEWIDGSPPEKLYDLRGNEASYDKVELAYLAPPVVAEKYDDVLLPFLSLMRAELHANAHKGDRPGWLQMDRKTAVLEVYYHLGKLHQAVHRGEEAAIKEYAADVANMCMMLLDVCACLDATAALKDKPTNEVTE